MGNHTVSHGNLDGGGMSWHATRKFILTGGDALMRGDSRTTAVDGDTASPSRAD